MSDWSSDVCSSDLTLSAETIYRNMKFKDIKFIFVHELILDSEQTADSLKQAEKKLSDMAVLIKNISTYQKTKDIYRAHIQ